MMAYLKKEIDFESSKILAKVLSVDHILNFQLKARKVHDINFSSFETLKCDVVGLILTDI